MPLLDLFWATLWIFLFVAWIWLLVSIYSDIFRSEDLGGWGKALWALFVLVLPFLGTFVYLIARGGSMTERSADRMAANKRATDAYIREVASSRPSTADEISKLASLADSGAITAEEFQTQKARLLKTDGTAPVASV